MDLLPPISENKKCGDDTWWWWSEAVDIVTDFEMDLLPQVEDIQTRAGKVQERVVHLQEKVQKYNPKKEKLRKFANNLNFEVQEELYF